MSDLGPHGLYAHIWKKDKERILHSNSRFSIQAMSPIPTDEDIDAIIMESERRQQNPTHTLVLHQSHIRDLMDMCIEENERLFGTTFDPYPDVVLVTPKEYTRFLQEAGNKDIPAASCLPENNQIVIPTKRLLKMGTGHIVNPYDAGFIQHELFFQYAHAMIRQLRGEWQSGFTDLCEELPENSLAGVQLFVGTLNAYARDQMLMKYKEWAVHGAAHKIRYIYSDDSAMRTYVGLVTMLEDTRHPRTLGQVSCLDVCLFDENGALTTGFYEAHPLLSIKQKMFYADKEKGD